MSMFPNNPDHPGKCVFCHTNFLVHDRIIVDPTARVSDEFKLTPGAVWSLAGFKETQISGMCEHCFDSTFEKLPGQAEYEG